MPRWQLGKQKLLSPLSRNIIAKFIAKTNV
jgi:hypothetical protein